MRADNLAMVNPVSTTDTTGNAGAANVIKIPQVEKVKAQAQAQVQVQEEKNEFKLNNEKARLKETVDKANKILEGSGRYFKYEVHKATNQVVISVIDDKTNEVITEIPPKKLLDVVGRLMELAGLVVDERR